MSTLVWGVKASLLAYVRGMGGGAVETTGVVKEPSGFAFPGTDGDGHTFSGSVRLTAHGGIMDVTLADPAIVPDGEHWQLTVAHGDGRLAVAAIDALTDRDGFLVASGTVMTAEGANLFAGPYGPGTPLDDPFIRD
ncbi:HtaA domain-containing protein [Microbacterium sp. GXF7504]